MPNSNEPYKEKEFENIRLKGEAKYISDVRKCLALIEKLPHWGFGKVQASGKDFLGEINKTGKTVTITMGKNNCTDFNNNAYTLLAKSIVENSLKNLMDALHKAIEYAVKKQAMSRSFISGQLLNRLTPIGQRSAYSNVSPSFRVERMQVKKAEIESEKPIKAILEKLILFGSSINIPVILHDLNIKVVSIGSLNKAMPLLIREIQIFLRTPLEEVCHGLGSNCTVHFNPYKIGSDKPHIPTPKTGEIPEPGNIKADITAIKKLMMGIPNPGEKMAAPTAIYTPQAISLSHELVHAYRAVRGFMTSEQHIEENITVGLPPFQYGIYSENRFRLQYEKLKKIENEMKKEEKAVIRKFYYDEVIESTTPGYIELLIERFNTLRENDELAFKKSAKDYLEYFRKDNNYWNNKIINDYIVLMRYYIRCLGKDGKTVGKSLLKKHMDDFRIRKQRKARTQMEKEDKAFFELIYNRLKKAYSDPLLYNTDSQ